MIQEPPPLHAKARRRSFGSEELLWLGLVGALSLTALGHEPKDSRIEFSIQMPKLSAKVHQGIEGEMLNQGKVTHHFVE